MGAPWFAGKDYNQRVFSSLIFLGFLLLLFPSFFLVAQI